VKEFFVRVVVVVVVVVVFVGLFYFQMNPK